MNEYDIAYLDNLKSSSEYMASDNYKLRLIAEYAQLTTRIVSILNMIWNMDDEKEEFGEEYVKNKYKDDKCPVELYSLQLEPMDKYKQFLEIRAKLYGIDLIKEVDKLNR